MYEAVFFDVGNTLLYPYPSVSAVVREVLADEGHCHDLDAIDRLMPLVDEFYEDRYREDDTFWRNEDETSAVWVGMYSLLCKELGITTGAERLARRVYDEFGRADRWRAYDDVEPALRRLKARGICIGLISNWDTRLESLFGGLGLRELIDVIISSASVGLHKPDPRIFQMACDNLGVAPSSSAHVGDHMYADMLGAQAVGITGVLIDRHCGPDPEFPRFIRSLESLECVLGMEGERT